jgi:hypothetical protein
MYFYLAFIRTAGGFPNIWFAIMEEKMIMTVEDGGGICKGGSRTDCSSAGGIL